MKSPIFIFSLPRSGSTLLQRILMSHDKIASVAEPWLLLPLCYANKKEGVFTEYNQSLSSKAIKDFNDNLPRQEDDYFEALSNMITTLYTKQCCDGEDYFLDKTPRYYLIIPEILKLFPEAKFIFLFRNPVHVYASLISSFGNNRLKNLYSTHIDLKVGPELLTKGYKLLAKKAIALTYEDLVKDPEKELRNITKYLDIEFKKELLQNFSHQDTKGSMGDPTGTVLYKAIEKKSLSKWKSVFSNHYRKRILLKYVKNLDADLLRTQGYHKQKIVKEIEQHNVGYGICLKDRIDYFYAFLVRRFRLNQFFSNSKHNDGKDIYLS